MGVSIRSEEQVIRGIYDRVTTLLPGEARLFCCERMSTEVIRLEALSPDEWRALADEHYAPGFEGEAPAAIMFTTAVTAQGVTEILHRVEFSIGRAFRAQHRLPTRPPHAPGPDWRSGSP